MSRSSGLVVFVAATAMAALAGAIAATFPGGHAAAQVASPTATPPAPNVQQILTRGLNTPDTQAPVWPTIDWETGSPVDVDQAKLDELLKVTEADHPKLGQTRAVLVIQGGRIVAERYAKGYDSQTRLVSWSMAKSFTQALLGVAVRQERVNIDTAMGNPRWDATDRRQAITWRQWITMTDGLRYLEIGAPSPAQSDAAKMTFGAKSRFDVVTYAAELPLIHEPGKHWNYSTAGINLVADGLTRTIAPEAKLPVERRAAMLSWMQRDLFERIGMWRAQPEFDATGTFIGGSLVYATAREFAKFGYLYLHDGNWDGERVLPEGWAAFAAAKTPGENADVYGAGWWRTADEGPGKPMDSVPPNGPKGAFSAQGHLGQIIMVVPSKDLVIVRLGVLPDVEGDWDALGTWTGDIMALFPERASLVAPRPTPLRPEGRPANLPPEPAGVIPN
jgi:CubicO group peptidase (beta-lactamase class C family)